MNQKINGTLPQNYFLTYTDFYHTLGKVSFFKKKRFVKLKVSKEKYCSFACIFLGRDEKGIATPTQNSSQEKIAV